MLFRILGIFEFLCHRVKIILRVCCFGFTARMISCLAVWAYAYPLGKSVIVVCNFRIHGQLVMLGSGFLLQLLPLLEPGWSSCVAGLIECANTFNFQQVLE